MFSSKIGDRVGCNSSSNVFFGSGGEIEGK